jgi:hypothetical protein
LPVAGRTNESRNVADLPLYSRGNDSRTSRASFVVRATLALAPLRPVTLNPDDPGWTARKAWSK